MVYLGGNGSLNMVFNLGEHLMKTEKEIENYIEVLKQINYHEAERWVEILEWIIKKNTQEKQEKK